MADKKTSQRIASIASKLLSNPKTSQDVKSIAASALAQASPKTSNHRKLKR